RVYSVELHCSGRMLLVDLAPTVLIMLSLPLPPTFQGESLVPLMKGIPKQAPDLPAYAETEYPHRAFGWSALRSLRTGKYLFVRAPRRELYDQSRDQSAEHNLASSSPAVTDTLQTQLDDFRNKTASSPDDAKKPAMNSEQAENLSALGYAATAPGSVSPD